MKTVKGKRALVTGASLGIGAAMARLLASRGADLIITARSADKLEALAEECRKQGVQVDVCPMDLSASDAAEKLYQWTKEQELQVDLLINNAGYGKWGEFLTMDRETYSNMLRLNIHALTELCHVFLPGMLERGGGGIINVGSTASFVPVPYAAVYSASKAYVIMFTEALHEEYSSKGLRAMTLCPGATTTNFATVAGDKVKHDVNDGDTPELVAEQGLNAFLKQKLYVITGNNKMVGWLPRILSRKAVARMVGNLFGKRTGMR